LSAIATLMLTSGVAPPVFAQTPAKPVSFEAEESRLYQMARDGKMPPGKTLQRS
jgi:hypothetical protein